MCGLVATIGEAPVDPSRIRAACDAMAHRGPDGFGMTTVRNGTVALGHRRLALVGGEAATQPLFGCKDSGISAVVNGEFYGYAALRTALVARGHHFTTRSDSEVLVHLWEEYGAGAIDHLRGEYAFALFDGKCLHLTRDISGVKPLHYAVDGDGRTWAASEIKALLAAGIPRRWSPGGLDQLFSMQFLAPTETLVAGVRAVAPGEHLVVGQAGIRMHTTREIRPRVQRPVVGDDAGLEGEIRDAFLDAVAVRLPEDGRIAFAVSGGFDSAAVVGAAAALGAPSPKGFAVAFSGEAWDERALAKAAISHANGELTVIEPTPEDFLDHLDSAVRFAEGAASNGQLVAKYMLSRAVRDAGFKAILTGEGADEAFLGYAHLLADAGAEATGATAQRGLMLPDGDGPPLPTTEALFAALGALVPTFLRAKSALAAQLAGLAARPLAERIGGDACIAHLCAVLLDGKEFSADHVRRSSFLWRKFALAGYILRTLGDGTELAHGVEGRPPFLDGPLLALAAAIPTATLLDRPRADLRDEVRDKALLRRALRAFVPAVVADRKKHPFLAPPLPRTAEVVARVRARTAPPRLPSFFDPAAVAAFVDAWADLRGSRSAVAQDGVLHLLLTTTALGEQLALEG